MIIYSLSAELPKRVCGEFRCKICGGFIDGRDLAGFEDHEGRCRTPRKIRCSAPTVAVSETASETSQSPREGPLHAGGNFSFSRSVPTECRLYDIRTFRDSWSTTKVG
jgi:hypothetical protein